MYDRARSGTCTNGHNVSIYFSYFELTESYSVESLEAFCETERKSGKWREKQESQLALCVSVVLGQSI